MNHRYFEDARGDSDFRLRKTVVEVENDPDINAWMRDITEQSNNNPDPKYAADHGKRHAERVVDYGLDFLEKCNAIKFPKGARIYPATFEDKAVFEVAAWLHDIGLVKIGCKDHAKESAKMVRKFFKSKYFWLTPGELEDVVHAISNHSAGKDTRNIIDAALLFGDKIDVSSLRILKCADDISTELKKVRTVNFGFMCGSRTEIPKYLWLDYEIKSGADFDPMILRKWKKSIAVPKFIAEEFLLIPFRFMIDGKEINYLEIING